MEAVQLGPLRCDVIHRCGEAFHTVTYDMRGWGRSEKHTTLERSAVRNIISSMHAIGVRRLLVTSMLESARVGGTHRSLYACC